jgi:hypothetical protein
VARSGASGVFVYATLLQFIPSGGGSRVARVRVRGLGGAAAPDAVDEKTSTSQEMCPC